MYVGTYMRDTNWTDDYPVEIPISHFVPSQTKLNSRNDVARAAWWEVEILCGDHLARSELNVGTWTRVRTE